MPLSRRGLGVTKTLKPATVVEAVDCGGAERLCTIASSFLELGSLSPEFGVAATRRAASLCAGGPPSSRVWLGRWSLGSGGLTSGDWGVCVRPGIGGDGLGAAVSS